MVNGEEIRRARVRMRLSQQELADRVGVSLRTIGNWELGHTSPGANEAVLLDVLGDYMQVGDGHRRSRFEDVTDAEMLAEIARRFARSVEREQQVGPSWSEPGPEPTVAGVKAAQEEHARHLKAVAQDGDQADSDAVDELGRQARIEQTGQEE